MGTKKKLGTRMIIGIVVLALLTVLGLVSEFVGTIQNYSIAELLLELSHLLTGVTFCFIMRINKCKT